MKVPRIVVMAADAAPMVMGAMQVIWGSVCWGESRGNLQLDSREGRDDSYGDQRRKTLFIEIVQL